MAEAQTLKALWLWLAFASSVAGFGWLALSMETHWQPVRGGCVPGTARQRLLRGLGSVALLLSLLACLQVDHVTMAVLVWVMLLTAAALAVTFSLSWRPRWLLPLALVLPTPTTAGCDDGAG